MKNSVVPWTAVTLFGTSVAVAAATTTGFFTSTALGGPLCESQARNTIPAADFAKVSNVVFKPVGAKCEAQLSDGTVLTWGTHDQHEHDKQTKALSLDHN